MIKKYIEFAVNNWFNECNLPKKLRKIKITKTKNRTFVRIIWMPWFCMFYSIQELITSREFIESITRWLKKLDWFIVYWIDWFTVDQAIAIRENKLEEFIKELGIW